MKRMLRALLAVSFALTTQITLADIGIRAGALDAVNHFPSHVVDVNNVALQLCLDGDGATGPCIFDPATAFPGNVWVATTGFGADAFYNRAHAKLVMPNGRQGDLSLSIQAGYVAGAPADGKQSVVARVSYSILVAGPGIYKVYHPYLAYPACQPDIHVALAPGTNQLLKYTTQVGISGNFDSSTGTNGGSILSWDPALAPAAPAGYLGDPQVAHPIVGSACNINVFRVEGPNIGGPGVGVASVANFSVTGKLYTAAATTPALIIDRATYDRSSAGLMRLEIFARALPSATVTLAAISGLNAATNFKTDNAGNFYVQVSGAAFPPRSVLISETPGKTRYAAVVDQVSVVSAVYNATSRALTIKARSSDNMALPLLSATVGKAPPVSMTRNSATGEFSATIANLPIPPAYVTVNSSQGGQETKWIQD